jgi:hypothetical protein
MTWTPTTLAALDASGAPHTIIAYTDGTNFSFAHPLLDNTGAIISPAVATGSVHLTASPTITAGAYTSGMVVGGLISLTGAARVSGGSGLIQTASVTVKTALTAPYDVLFFDTNPLNTTFTDNAALALNALDLPSLCGVAHCTDLVPLGTPQLLQAPGLALPFKLSGAATTLYAAVVLRGAQTFASTSAVGLTAVVLQD